MVNAPVLAIPDFTKNFGILMDASHFAIGGILFQVDERNCEHPVSFTGRILTTSCYFIIHAVKIHI
jgi:RNase H-like domain found in reverse transcriptase